MRDARKPEAQPEAPSEAIPGAPALTLKPRAGTVTCRRWLAAPVAGRRLFVCASGRYALEQCAPAGEASSFLLWHLTSEHRQATQRAWDSAGMLALLSFIAPGELDAPGIIFSA